MSTQGVTVTDHSPLLGTPYTFDIYSMFRSKLPGGTEPKSVIFADGGFGLLDPGATASPTRSYRLISP